MKYSDTEQKNGSVSGVIVWGYILVRGMSFEGNSYNA